MAVDVGWIRTSRHRVLQKGVILLRTKRRDTVSTASIVGEHLLTGQEESMLFVDQAMAPHCSTLAWKIPWTEEPGGLQSIGSLRIGHD